MLEPLGCDHREVLMASRDQHGFDIGVAQSLCDDGNEEDKNTGSTTALLGESFSS